MRGPCSAMYPVMLLHGLAYRDDMFCIESWGRGSLTWRLPTSGRRTCPGSIFRRSTSASSAI